MRALSILMMVALLAGCADTRKFYKPNTTLADFKTDTYSCERDARSVYASFGGGLVGALEAREFSVRCMEAKGWSYR